MDLHGIPNDIMQNIDPLTIIIVIPIMDRLIYPLLRRLGINLKPITRITIGFFCCAIAMLYAAFVQIRIYTSPPCFSSPSACAAAKLPDGGYKPNSIHVAIQTPSYIFIALSEIFASVTGLEFAFTKAPASMKSLIMSLFLLTNAFGAALGAALSPSAKDPYLVWMYMGLAVACVVAGAVFWVLYRHLNDAEDDMNELDRVGEKPVPVVRGGGVGGSGERSIRRKKRGRVVDDGDGNA